MKTTTSTKPSTRKDALFTVYGTTARSLMPVTLGQVWAKKGTTTMWMAKVKLTTDPRMMDALPASPRWYIYAKSTDKAALVEWIRANTPVKGVKSVSARRTYNGHWEKVVARRDERNFTATAAKV